MNEQLIIVYRNLAETYKNLRQYHKSLKYHEQHIAIAQKRNNIRELEQGFGNKGLTLVDISELLLEKNEFFDIQLSERFMETIDSAIVSLGKSLELCEKMIKKKYEIEIFKDRKAEGLLNLGNAYVIKGKHDADFYDKALQAFESSLNFAKSIGYSLMEGRSHFNKGLVYYEKKQFQQAIDNFVKDEKICRQEKELNGLRAVYQNLGLCYQELRQFSQANHYFNKGLQIVDQHFPQDSAMRKTMTINLKNLYELQKKEETIEQELQTFFKKNQWTLAKINEVLNKLIYFANNPQKAKTFFTLASKKLNIAEILPWKNKEINQETLVFLHFGANIEKSLNNFARSKELFELIQRNSAANIRKSWDFISFLIDYGNLLDEMKGNIREIEKIYWQAYEIARELNDKVNCETTLNNLYALYSDRKDVINEKKVKEMLKAISNKMENEDDQFLFLDIHQEFSDISAEKLSDEEQNYDEEEYLSEKEEDFLAENREEISKESYDEDDAEENQNYKEKIAKKQKYSNINQTIVKKQENPILFQEKNKENIFSTTKALRYYEEYCNDHLIPDLDAIKQSILSKKLHFPKQYLGDIVLRPCLKAVSFMQEIIEINLSFNQLNNKSLSILYKRLQIANNFRNTLSQFDISFNYFENSEEILAKTIELVCKTALKLEVLNVSGIKLRSSLFFIEILQGKSQLKELRCKKCGLEDQDVDLSQISHENQQKLQFLDISHNNLTEKTLYFFATKLKKLIFLDFSYNLRSIDKKLNEIQSFSVNQDLENILLESSLKTLKIKGFCHEIRGIKEILPLLDYLDISFSTEQTINKVLESFIDHFFKQKLMGNQCFGKLTTLKMKAIVKKHEENSEFFIENLIKMIIQQPELKLIDFSKNSWKYIEIIEMIKRLPNNTSQKVILAGNPLLSQEEKDNIMDFTRHLFNEFKEVSL